MHFSINNVLEKNCNDWQLIILNILSTATFPFKGCLKKQKLQQCYCHDNGKKARVVPDIILRKNETLHCYDNLKHTNLFTIILSFPVTNYKKLRDTSKNSIKINYLLCHSPNQNKTLNNTKKNQHYCFVSATRITVSLQTHYSRLLILTFRQDILPLLPGSSPHSRSETK